MSPTSYQTALPRDRFSLSEWMVSRVHDKVKANFDRQEKRERPSFLAGVSDGSLLVPVVLPEVGVVQTAQGHDGLGIVLVPPHAGGLETGH